MIACARCDDDDGDDDDNEVELRCYYGTIYYSITGIQLEAFDDNDTSDANKRFGIKEIFINIAVIEFTFE